MEKEKSTDFIWGDFIDIKICDDLLEFKKQQTLTWTSFLPITEGQNYNSKGDINVDKNVKDSVDLYIPHQINVPHIQNFLAALQTVLNSYCNKFPFCKTSRFELMQGMRMQSYPVSGGYKAWHTERANASPNTVYRHLAWMTYLNDVPDGGTEWFHQNLYIPAQKGYTIIWPCDWTHTHRGRVSHTLEKHIITGWFSFT